MNRRASVCALLSAALLTLFSGNVQAAWKTTSAGTIYTTSGSPGYYTGWHDIKKGSKTYRYYFDSKGLMKTGFVTIKDKRYYFDESGRLQYGFIKVNGKVYYARKTTGALVSNAWVNSKYYFQDNYTMAVNKWINGKWVGSDGAFTGKTGKIGFITENGRTYYYDKSGNKVTGWLTISGKKYYLTSSSGILKTGWFTVSGNTYYANARGVVQTSTWSGSRYLTSSGAMATGWLDIGDKRYYFNSKGKYSTGWTTISGKVYYFSSTGVMQKSTWITVKKKKYYIGSDGVRVTGMAKIKGKYYYLSKKSGGCLLYQWIGVGNSRYYAKATTGELLCKQFFSNSTYTYYAMSDCKIATGLHKINGHLYCFTSTQGRMICNQVYTIDGATYYFQENGRALISKWKEIDGKYYYFGSDGKLVKNTVVDGYRIGSTGARGSQVSESTTTGWLTVNGKTVYLKNGKALTGWQTIDGNTYYLNSSGTPVTGLKTIDSKKYYFDSDGILAVGKTVTVGTKEYTADASGVLTLKTTDSSSGSEKGEQIAKYALQYVGNPYVYGGTSLTNGADCSGFVQTVFANNGIKLLRTADEQLHGPSSSLISSGYKAAKSVSQSELLPGDLVFYGYGSYASHVGIYIGNGQIVNASNSQPYPAGGIKVQSYDYRTPIGYVRYWS